MTVVTESFVPGALVMLDSFRTHNPWFTGDVVIATDELAEPSRQRLRSAVGGIRFLAPSPELTRRIERVVAACPPVAGIRAMFLALEAFGLRGYDKVLSCDSDLLFTRSMRPLFDMPEAFIAAGDLRHYRTGSGTFNAGLVVIGREHLTDGGYREVLDWTRPDILEPRWQLGDQAVLNACFAGRVRVVGGEFNYLLACHDEIRERAGVPLSAARAIHFNYGKKPWAPDQALHAASADPVVAAASRMWLNSFASLIERDAAAPPGP